MSVFFKKKKDGIFSKNQLTRRTICVLKKHNSMVTICKILVEIIFIFNVRGLHLPTN